MANDLIQAQRILQAVDVIRLRRQDPKMTLEKACAVVGISTDIYYYWLEKSPEAVNAITELGQEVERRSMAMIAMSIERILGKLIEDGTSKGISAAERLMIFKELDARYQGYVNKIAQANQHDSDAATLLTGPNLTHASQITAQIDEDSIHLTIRQKPSNIIDITPSSKDSPAKRLFGDAVDE